MAHVKVSARFRLPLFGVALVLAGLGGALLRLSVQAFGATGAVLFVIALVSGIVGLAAIAMFVLGLPWFEARE